VFDYAAVAPYIEINMNGPSGNRRFNFDVSGKEKLAYKDAVVISPHKFIGGPGTSGVLIAKKQVMYDNKPYRPGGGSVFYNNGLDHTYIDNPEEMEEAGTPGIIQDIRTGLVF
jgi:selenocysteine lyase/cysteine desulfurase